MDDDTAARLDHIEQYLVRVSQRSGPTYTPTPGFVPASADVIELARSGDAPGAIARYQQATGATLDRATAVIAGL